MRHGISTSKVSSSAHLIELECKWSTFCDVEDLELAEAEAKAQVAKAKEAAITVEAKACFSIKEAKMEAEVKLLELSQCGLSVSSKLALKKGLFNKRFK